MVSKFNWIDGGKRLVIRNGNKKWPPQSKMAANQWPPINGRRNPKWQPINPLSPITFFFPINPLNPRANFQVNPLNSRVIFFK